jgi:hypothetical protein
MKSRKASLRFGKMFWIINIECIHPIYIFVFLTVSTASLVKLSVQSKLIFDFKISLTSFQEQLIFFITFIKLTKSDEMKKVDHQSNLIFRFVF